MTVILPRTCRPLTALFAVVVVGLAPLACQPVDELEEVGGPSTEADGVEEANRRGAPLRGEPGSVAEAIDRAQTEAAQWQDGARLAEVFVDLADDGDFAAVRLTYLAPDAERLLAIRVDEDGTSQERPSLDTFGLAAMPGSALEELPPLPEGAREPSDLLAAAEDALAHCEAPNPTQVLYATEAPQAWDPDSQVWTTELDWTVTVSDEDGAGVVLDPVTAEPAGCLPPSG